jgi:hypothetical protein
MLSIPGALRKKLCTVYIHSMRGDISLYNTGLLSTRLKVVKFNKCYYYTLTGCNNVYIIKLFLLAHPQILTIPFLQCLI